MENGNSKKWGELGVGDIIIVSQGENFPADVIIVDVSDGEKLAFVETKNLDGETNLKSKICPTMPSGARLPQSLHGWSVQCEPPSDKIYQFNGVLSNGRGIEIGLGYDNFCLRGSSLRNTEFIVGIVTYTGNDTKVMRNSVPSAQKQSKLEYETGRYILYIFLVMICLCFIAAVYIQILGRRLPG
jgi:magnesium-transporting ATPase (P-type)